MEFTLKKQPKEISIKRKKYLTKMYIVKRETKRIEKIKQALVKSRKSLKFENRLQQHSMLVAALNFSQETLKKRLPKELYVKSMAYKCVDCKLCTVKYGWEYDDPKKCKVCRLSPLICTFLRKNKVYRNPLMRYDESLVPDEGNSFSEDVYGAGWCDDCYGFGYGPYTLKTRYRRVCHGCDTIKLM